MMSLVIDADGHVEENLADLVGAIPAAMQPHAMRFVSITGGHVTYEIEGGRDPKVRLQVLEDEGIDAAVLYPSVGMMFGLLENPDIAAARRQAWHIAAAGGGTPMNRDAASNYGDLFNTHQFTGLFESMARRELRRDPTILD